MSHRIGYVTDLDRRAGGGGSYAVNWHAYDQLSKSFEMSYLGPIVPDPPIIDSLISKARRRILKLPGNFYYFSPRTLALNAKRVQSMLDDTLDGVMFRSSTRWCETRILKPYFIYLDAVFHTFFNNTFQADDFILSDLERIYEREARFLENAKAVFFESQWGLEKAKTAYSLRGERFVNTGRGGSIEAPARDTWDGRSINVVTIAMNFSQKGGDIVLGAYRSLKRDFPDLSWHIIGGEPPDGVSTLPGVRYEGILDPEKAADRKRLEKILANAFLLLHPTLEDTSPLVITEANYFGCPAISVERFAIPELIRSDVTGILIENASSLELEEAVRRLIQERHRYVEMRAAAREYAITRFTWDRVGKEMTSVISEALV